MLEITAIGTMTTSTKTTTASLIRTRPKAGTTQARAKGRVWQEEFDLLLMRAPEAGSSKNNTSGDHARARNCVTFITSTERN